MRIKTMSSNFLKMSLIKKYISLFVLISAIVLIGCNTTGKKTKPAERKKHWIEIGLQGEGMMYLDGVPNGMVMQETKADSSTHFCSFLVGFQDSSMTIDEKKEEKKEQYYQYEMYKNWKAIVNGDSISPVFYQPKIRLQKQTDEGILVFELPQGKEADTLVYKDTYGPWGTQQIILNQ